MDEFPGPEHTLSQACCTGRRLYHPTITGARQNLEAKVLRAQHTRTRSAPALWRQLTTTAAAAADCGSYIQGQM